MFNWPGLAPLPALDDGPAAIATAISLVMLIAVPLVRDVRYLRDKVGFVERSTPHHAGVQWMNAHLDRLRHRVRPNRIRSCRSDLR